ncbi:MAG: hypothetical protein AVDCRST_MAG59-5152, partial [uncultured Thermomicrobiales bacterium]
ASIGDREGDRWSDLTGGSGEERSAAAPSPAQAGRGRAAARRPARGLRQPGQPVCHDRPTPPEVDELRSADVASAGLWRLTLSSREWSDL